MACSRATTLSGLYIIGKFIPPTPLPENSYLAREIERWKKKRVVPKFKFLSETSNCLQIMYHNIQSLPKHINLVRKDSNFTNSHILIFGETWTIPKDHFRINDYQLVQKLDSGLSRKPLGVSMYVKKSLCKQITEANSFSLKENHGRIDVVFINLKKITIAGVYANPRTSLNLWNKLFKYFQRREPKELIMMGDVNMDSRKLKSNDQITVLLQKYNLLLTNKNSASTHFNTCLDWILANDFTECGTYCSYFSVHHPIWTRKAWSHRQVIPQNYQKLP